MPFRYSHPMRRPTEQQFYELNHLVVGHSFDIQNEFGRLMDESIYKRELARRLRKDGVNSVQEAKMTLTHGNFTKDYFMDLLLDNCTPVEAKVVETLGAPQRSQTLNYLFVAELPHASLINYRPPQLEYEFVSTTHTLRSRRRLSFHTHGWQSLTASMNDFRARLIAVFEDWGGLLEVNAYREAMTYAMAGAHTIARGAEIFSEGESLGPQPMLLVENDIAFSITALTHDQDVFKIHLLRMIEHTQLKALIWVNMNKLNISFETLLRQ